MVNYIIPNYPYNSQENKGIGYLLSLIFYLLQQNRRRLFMKFWLCLILLILAFLAYVDYRDFNDTCSTIPQFTDEQMRQICIEEGIPLD